MGVLSDAVTLGTWSGRTLGLECAGEIVRVGPGVAADRVGGASRVGRGRVPDLHHACRNELISGSRKHVEQGDERSFDGLLWAQRNARLGERLDPRGDRRCRAGRDPWPAAQARRHTREPAGTRVSAFRSGRTRSPADDRIAGCRSCSTSPGALTSRLRHPRRTTIEIGAAISTPICAVLARRSFAANRSRSTARRQAGGGRMDARRVEGDVDKGGSSSLPISGHLLPLQKRSGSWPRPSARLSLSDSESVRFIWRDGTTGFSGFGLETGGAGWSK